MANEKSEIWAAFKELGVTPQKKFVQYTTEELKAEYLSHSQKELSDTYDALVDETPPEEPSSPEQASQPVGPPAASAPAGVKHAPTPDSDGLVWLQKEVRKPAYPKPRGRRVLKYNDPGVREVTVSNGEYTETYEMPGDRNRPSEIKITLPSYQVGIYKDPRYPFRIAVYNENRGYLRQDVENFYGGRDLVPADIKRKYVENVLCYDIRTTNRAINAEYRDRVLKKGSAA